jgi:hypothetical protein
MAIVDKEGFTAPAPCKTEALLGSIAWGAIIEGVDDIEGGCEVKVIIKEWALQGIAVLDGTIDVERGAKEVFVFVGWQPYISFFANIASWNKWLTILYSYSQHYPNF